MTQDLRPAPEKSRMASRINIPSALFQIPPELDEYRGASFTVVSFTTEEYLFCVALPPIGEQKPAEICAVQKQRLEQYMKDVRPHPIFYSAISAEDLMLLVRGLLRHVRPAKFFRLRNFENGVLPPKNIRQQIILDFTLTYYLTFAVKSPFGRPKIHAEKEDQIVRYSVYPGCLGSMVG